jgi:hypothetical protein
MVDASRFSCGGQDRHRRLLCPRCQRPPRRRAAEQRDELAPFDQRSATSSFDPFPNGVHRRQPLSQRQGIDADAVAYYERVDTDIKCVRAAIERLEMSYGANNADLFRRSD